MQNQNGYQMPGIDYNAMPSFQTETNDIPPELGEIKNLNEATVAQAPTMDVLGPIHPLAQEHLYAAGTALKRLKKKKKTVNQK